MALPRSVIILSSSAADCTKSTGPPPFAMLRRPSRTARAMHWPSRSLDLPSVWTNTIAPRLLPHSMRRFQSAPHRRSAISLAVSFSRGQGMPNARSNGASAVCALARSIPGALPLSFQLQSGISSAAVTKRPPLPRASPCNSARVSAFFMSYWQRRSLSSGGSKKPGPPPPAPWNCNRRSVTAIYLRLYAAACRRVGRGAARRRAAGITVLPSWPAARRPAADTKRRKYPPASACPI